MDHGRTDPGRRPVAIPDPFPEPPAVDDEADRPASPPAFEERLADARRSSVEAGRRKAGLAGAALAGSMLALRDIYEGPPRDELPIEIEASGQPHDVDRDGISLIVGGVEVSAPALTPPRWASPSNGGR